MIKTQGRFLLETGNEAICTAIISKGARVEVRKQDGLPAVCPGMKATCYLDEVGVVPGRISEINSAGFTMLVEASAERKARIEDRLAWLHAHANDTADQRNDRRIVPTQRNISVKLPGGQIVSAQIVDLSMSGAALVISERPDPGSAVTVGKRFATVVRQTVDGIAVRFKLPFSPTTFNEHVAL